MTFFCCKRLSFLVVMFVLLPLLGCSDQPEVEHQPIESSHSSDEESVSEPEATDSEGTQRLQEQLMNTMKSLF